MIPDAIKTWRYIAETKRSQWVSTDLILAIVWTESSGNPWAYNPEPRYRWFWDVRKQVPFRQLTQEEISSEEPPVDFPYLAGGRDQEWWAQQASFGLMQTMGAVARERGFNGPYLTELCDPETSIDYGVRHLTMLMRKHELRVALLRWNGGGNPNYPDEVLRKLAAIRG